MVLEVGDQQGASRGSTTGLGSCHPMEAAQRPWLVSEHIPRAAGGFNVVKRRHRGMLLGVVRRQGGEAFSFIAHLSGGLDPINATLWKGLVQKVQIPGFCAWREVEIISIPIRRLFDHDFRTVPLPFYKKIFLLILT